MWDKSFNSAKIARTIYSEEKKKNKEEKYWTEKKEQKKGKEKEKNFETEQYELTVCQ